MVKNNKMQEALDFLTGPAYLALSEHDLQFVHNCRINLVCGTVLSENDMRILMDTDRFYRAQMDKLADAQSAGEY